MKYLKIWTSFRQTISTLNDSEKGRLFDAMLMYAETGAEPSEFKGNERFLWIVAKQDIDRTAQKCETLKANASKGGIAKSKNQQMLANDSKVCQIVANVSKPYQTEANVSYKEKKRKEIESKEISSNDDNRACAREEAAVAAADDAINNELIRINGEQNRVLDAAEDAGFLRSNSVRAKLISLYADHGLDKMLAGISSCVQHGVVNLAYLEAALKGEPKKPKDTGPKLPAQEYHQRDYPDAQEEAFERMMALGADGA